VLLEVHTRDSQAQVAVDNRVCSQIGTDPVLQAEAVVDDSHQTLELEHQEAVDNHDSPEEMEDACSRVLRWEEQEDSHSVLP